MAARIPFNRRGRLIIELTPEQARQKQLQASLDRVLSTSQPNLDPEYRQQLISQVLALDWFSLKGKNNDLLAGGISLEYEIERGALILTPSNYVAKAEEVASTTPATKGFVDEILLYLIYFQQRQPPLYNRLAGLPDWTDTWTPHDLLEPPTKNDT